MNWNFELSAEIALFTNPLNLFKNFLSDSRNDSYIFHATIFQIIHQINIFLSKHCESLSTSSLAISQNSRVIPGECIINNISPYYIINIILGRVRGEYMIKNKQIFRLLEAYSFVLDFLDWLLMYIHNSRILSIKSYLFLNIIF